jgi:NAD-dependent deacetylase
VTDNYAERSARFNAIIKGSENIVFFGGAGVSTESGIPDFRSVDGLYNLNYKYPPERIISRSFFDEKPEEFYRFYREKMIFRDAKPNAAHLKLAELEKAGKLRAVVTQNIDNLHQMAGSKNVLELHGSVYRNFCQKCGKPAHGVEVILNARGIPQCGCGGRLKPDVVLYEEGLSEGVLKAAVKAISEAETLIVGGTSLSVYPAAGLVDYFRGGHIVLINKGATSRGIGAELAFSESIGKVMGEVEV